MSQVTSEEVISLLKEDIKNCKRLGNYGEEIEADEIAIEALRYRTPKKVLYTFTNSKKLIYGCPTCERFIPYRGQKFCSEYGQKLNWEEEECG